MSRRSFFGGAVILMLAGFIVRIFGFVYRIYLSNLIGAEGMGLFQLISPIYSLVILTLTSGISIAVSKMVAGELALRHLPNLRRITKCALVIVLAAGSVVSVIMLFNLDFVVNVILKDSRTYYSMLLMIPCIPVIAAASALKGYFYGIQDVTPPACSQIAEQIVKIGLVMVMAGYFLKLGLEYACALATIGMALGEISNLLVLWIIYIIKKRKERLAAFKLGTLRKRKIILEIVRISLPVSANRFITSIMSAVEFILIPRMLVAGGMNYTESMELYGRLSGMALPLIFFPSLVTSSLATTLVPAISEAVSLKNFRSVNYRISKSIQITFVLGFIFTAVFLSYPDMIGDLLYRREHIGELLYMLSFTCVLMYLSQILTGVMNGLGRQGISLRNSVIGSIIRICFVYFAIPQYGIRSYILGILASYALLCTLNLITVIKTTGLVIELRNWLFMPGFVCIVIFFSSKFIYHFCSIFTSNQVMLTVLSLAGNITAASGLMFVVGVLQLNDIKRLLGIKTAKT